MHTRFLHVTLLAASLAALSGCGQHDKTTTTGDATPAPADSMADSATTAAADLAAGAPNPHDPCGLITQAEAEAFLGAPLAGPPYLSGNPIGDRAEVPDADGSVCWYSTADNRNFTVTAEWKQGGTISAGVAAHADKAEAATKGLLKLKNGTELTGDWDEARLNGCCSFSALQGDSLVEIDFGGSMATTEQAAALADKALARLAAPLSIDGRAGVAAAQKRLDARYASDDPCALWSADDIANLLGTPNGQPERSGNECTWNYRSKQGRGAMFVATVNPLNGYRLFRTQNATFAGFAQGINAMSAAEGVQLRASHGVEGPWEAAVNGPIQFNSVRKDASIALRQSGMSEDDIRALLGHAYDRIEAGAAR